jgi:hypothetical protein
MGATPPVRAISRQMAALLSNPDLGEPDLVVREEAQPVILQSG